MSAVWEIGRRAPGCVGYGPRPRSHAARYARWMPDTRRFEGPSDLHLHSIHSDGTESAAQVMAAAHRHGLRTAALTDHDTTSGWAEAAEAAASLGMTFIPGMELSAKHEWRSVHVLAYLIDPDDVGLRAMTDRIRSSRLERARTHGRPHRPRLRPALGRHRRADLGRRHGRAPAHRRRPRRARASCAIGPRRSRTS